MTSCAMFHHHIWNLKMMTLSFICEKSPSLVKMSSSHVIFSFHVLKCKFTLENMISCAMFCFHMREFYYNKNM